MLTTIFNNTICRFKTGHGLSAIIYMSNALRRILVTSQGSCTSPSIWVAALDLDPVLWSIETKYICFKLTILTGTSIDRIGDMYVDKSAPMCLSQDLDFKNKQKILNLNKHMGKIAQDFEKKLFSIGGSFSISKYV